jgi:hypothetical protein
MRKNVYFFYIEIIIGIGTDYHFIIFIDLLGMKGTVVDATNIVEERVVLSSASSGRTTRIDASDSENLCEKYFIFVYKIYFSLSYLFN